MNDVVFSAIERELARWDWQMGLGQRPETDLGVSVLTLLVEEQSLRNIELGHLSSLNAL